MVPQFAALRQEVFGRNASVKRAWMTLAVGEFLLLVIVLTADTRSGLNVWPRESQLLVWGAVGSLLLLAASGSYLRAGALPSLAVCVLPVVGLFLFILGDGMVRPNAGSTFVVMRAALFGLLFGLCVGIPGYFLGFVIRGFSNRWAPNQGGMLS